VVTDVLASKRDLALRLGADAVVDAAAPDGRRTIRDTLGESADVVFDCVAIARPLGQAIRLATRAAPWSSWRSPQERHHPRP